MKMKSNSAPSNFYRINEIIRSKIRPRDVRREFFKLFGYNKTTMYYKMNSLTNSTRRFSAEEEAAIAAFLNVPIDDLYYHNNLQPA